MSDVKFHPDIVDISHVREVIRHERKFQQSKRDYLRDESMRTQYYLNMKRRKGES